jgi:hypothetical protein
MTASAISAHMAEEVMCVIGVAVPERRLAVAVAAGALTAEGPVRSPSR